MRRFLMAVAAASLIAVPVSGQALPPPTITGVSPTSCANPCGTITISGTNFAGTMQVFFGGNPSARPTTLNSTTIQATPPPQRNGSRLLDVMVTRSDGQSATAPGALQFVDVPTVTSVTPTQGPATGGTLVTISGTNFVNPAVAFDGIAGTPMSSTGTQVSVVTPPNAAGPADILITNPHNQTATVANAYTFLVAPTIASVTPSAGPFSGGTTVTIGGSNFAAGATVFFGTTPGTSTSVIDSATIRTVTPAHLPGFADVTVKNPDGTQGSKARAFQFNCVAPPIIEQPRSMSIPAGGMATLTVTAAGANLTYQWYEGMSGDFSKPAPSRTSSFTTPPLTSTTSYWVRVTNACTSTDSTTATITVDAGMTTRPFILVSNRPDGLIQRPGIGGGTDSFTLTNVGDATSTITLTQSGAFFTQSPTQFTLNPRQSQVVRLTGLPQPAGFQVGQSLVSGDGVQPNLAVNVRLISVPAPAGIIDVRPVRARVDVSGRVGENPSGAVAFLNAGNTPAVGVAVADAPWIRPEMGLITINPGESRTISFEVDRALRGDAQSLRGSARGKVSFRHLRGSGANAAMDVNGAGDSTATISISIVDVVKPTVTPSDAPPLLAGEVAKFLPGLLQRTGVSTDVLLSSTSAAPVSDLRIFYSSGVPGAQTLLNNIGSLAVGSVLSLGGAVSNVFGVSGGAGTGQVRSTEAESISVSAVQGNYESSDGAYTTAVPVFRSDRSVAGGGSMLLPGAVKDNILRTDVYVQELAGFSGTVQIDVLSENGTVLSSRATDTMAAFGLLEVTDIAPAGNSTIRVRNTSGSGATVGAYAMVRDQVTNDAWVITDWSSYFGGTATERLIVPVPSLSRQSAASTRMFLANSGTESVTATLKLLAPAAARRRAVRSGQSTGNTLKMEEQAQQTVTLQPLQTTSIDDALAAIGATTSTTAYAVIEASGPITTAARTTMGIGKFNASLGTGIPLFPSSYGLVIGGKHRFSGVDDASQRSIDTAVPATFRSTLTLIETAGQAATVRVTLSYSFAASERVVATGVQSTAEFQVGANQITAIDNLARAVIGADRDNYGDLRDMQVDVEVVGGEGRVIALMESTDNRSGDVILRTE